MKVLLDINDNKVSFVMELLNSLNFVKVETLPNEKTELVNDLKEAVDELNLVKEGKLKARDVDALIDEL